MRDAFHRDLKISMLGARGVGKTSMIAAMHEQFDRVFPDPDLQLIPSLQSAVDLQNLLIDLKRVASGKPGYVDTGQGGVRDTNALLQHELRLQHAPTGTWVGLQWLDYPGGWIESRPAEVRSALADASIILVAIDAPALMRRDEADHEAITAPSLGSAWQRSIRSPRRSFLPGGPAACPGRPAGRPGPKG